MAIFDDNALSPSGRSLAAQGFPAAIPESRHAGAEAAAVWRRLKAKGGYREFASQSGQDCLLDTRLFRGRRGGVFLDIGGYDGTTGSNTLFFERHRGWTGVLIEPAQRQFDLAQAARGCTCLNLAAGDATGTATFVEVEAGFTQMSGLMSSYDPTLLTAVRADPRHRERLHPVPVRTLADIVDMAGIVCLDLVSLDIEGGEMAALAAFPFDRVPVGAWIVENNAGSAEIARFMAGHGYGAAAFLGQDEVYLPAGASFA